MPYLLTITTETAAQRAEILATLTDAENECRLEFPFSVQSDFQPAPEPATPDER